MEHNLTITNLDLTKLVLTNTIQKRKRKIYLDIMDKCEHVTER